jgi:hypothetical protein
MSGTESMTEAEYAAYERAMGARVLEAGGVWWRQVRPFFYRPLIPFQALDPERVQPPRAARLGGFQHVVDDPARANSRITLLLFRRANEYQLESFEKKRRWEVRVALKNFQVQRLSEREPLAREGHAVYLEFRRRTGYSYRADREDPERFAAWVTAVVQTPKVLVWGAFEAGVLQAVAVGVPVERTLFYSTFFARERALKLHVASLMLHTARAHAAACDWAEVYAGLRKQGREAGVDEFYLQRGCEAVSLPARYRLNPLIESGLRLLMPRDLDRITGAVGKGTEAAEPLANAAHERRTEA